MLKKEHGRTYIVLPGFGSERDQETNSKSSSRSTERRGKESPKPPPASPDTFDNSLEFEIAVLEREVEYFYGWGRFRPASLQWCRSPYFILVALCLCNMVHACGIFGVFPASAHHLQLRFHLSPVELGQIRMMYDVGALIMIGPVIYFGVRGANRPAWIGTGTLLVGFSALLFTLPQFFVTPHEFDISREKCTSTPLIDHPTCGTPVVKYFFMFAGLLYGIGTLPAATMGLTYLDENVPPDMSVVFTGVYMISVLVGSSLGYLMTSRFLGIYGELDKSPQIEGLTAKSPVWYGAWWIGMLIMAVMAWLTAIPVLGFPRRLPGAMRWQMGEIGKRFYRKWLRDEDSEASTAGNTSFAAPVLKVLRRCKEVVLNPAFVGLVVDFCVFNFFITAFSFMPYYLHLVMHVYTDSAASLCATLVGVSFVALMVGVALQRVLHLDVKGNIRLSLIASIANLVFIAVLVVHCPSSSLAGVTDRYPIYSDGEITGINVSCNSNCSCLRDRYEPVCYNPHVAEGTTAISGTIGPERFTTHRPHQHAAISYNHHHNHHRGVVMYSGCYAGCKESNATHFYNCECVPIHPNLNSEPRGGGAVEKGACPRTKHQENYLRAFMVGISWAVFALFVRVNAVRQSLLHCVRFKNRVISLAIASACGRIFGAIPSSPIVGKLFSMACVVKIQRCGKDFGCVWADATSLMWTLLITGYVVATICVIGLLVAALKFKDPVEKSHGNIQSILSKKTEEEDDDLVTAELADL